MAGLEPTGLLRPGKLLAGAAEETERGHRLHDTGNDREVDADTRALAEAGDTYAAARQRAVVGVNHVPVSRPLRRQIAICRASTTSSARSSLVRPSRLPSSMSAWRSQFRRQLSAILRSAAICETGFTPSRASSTARRRNSGGCGRGLRTPYREEHHPPQGRCPPKWGKLIWRLDRVGAR
jgi:hypothetical protein